MQEVTLPEGRNLPALGLGTWRMGERADQRSAEVAALRQAFEIGYRVVDTAEMYGEGGAEEVLGAAIRDAERHDDISRSELFVVSKVYPHNASFDGVIAAAERSLQRLGLDHLDLYLLHWRGAHPLADTVRAFETLQQQGRIHRWGVSNFDVDDMRELLAVLGGDRCSANQVYYSLSERGVEHDLAPWLVAHSMPLMAYSPIDQGVLASHPSLRALADRRGCTPAQLALAWLLAQPQVIAIPKASRAAHLRDNHAAAGFVLDTDELQQLDRLFPPPKRKRPLAMR